jgi:hypothetical protein
MPLTSAYRTGGIMVWMADMGVSLPVWPHGERWSPGKARGVAYWQ